jgi:hypothetical protein
MSSSQLENEEKESEAAIMLHLESVNKDNLTAVFVAMGTRQGDGRTS